MALLGESSWGEFHLRHWAGKTAFMATFKRSLFLGMAEVFSQIERARKGPTQPTAVVCDEIFVMLCQSVLSEVNLRAVISPEVSCTDASTTGGGSATATHFLKGPPREAEEIAYQDSCGLCQQPIDPLDAIHGFKCPSLCGAVMCCIQCVADRRKKCRLFHRYKPVFGERFSGPNYPLTRAVAREGIAVQSPLDVVVEDDEWDFFSAEGKHGLEDPCDDGDLMADHWGPECKTFSAARGKPIWTSAGGTSRSAEPWQAMGFTKPQQAAADSSS